METSVHVLHHICLNVQGKSWKTGILHLFKVLCYTEWSKSLCAPDDCSTNHQVHRDFLITCIMRVMFNPLSNWHCFFSRLLYGPHYPYKVYWLRDATKS